MTDRWCKHCNGLGMIRYATRPAEKCNCGGPYRGGASNEVPSNDVAEAIMRQHSGIQAERRAREMTAELPCETRAMMQLKGMM